MEGENLFQPYNFKDVLDAGTERGESQLSLEPLYRLKIFDERGEAGGVDVVDARRSREASAGVFSTTSAFRNSRNLGEVSRSMSPVIETTGMFSSVRSVICIKIEVSIFLHE